MVLKKCNKCLVEKELSCFSKDKNRKDGHYSICKGCKKEYRLNNTELIDNYKKKYYKENKILILEKSKEYYLDNKDIKIKKSKLYYEKNKKTQRIRQKQYYFNNKEYLLNKAKNYVNENYDKVLKYQKKYKQNKFKEDPIFRIIICVRARVNIFLKSKNIKKNNKTFEIVGCSPEFLKEYLENQFIDGMSWENQGKWHIDHIIPLSSAKTEEEIYNLCHYTNLQPLWAEDNMKKGNKVLCNKIKKTFI
jgi:hypothetical protein